MRIKHNQTDIFSTPIYHIQAEEKDYNDIESMRRWTLDWKKKDKGVQKTNKGGYHSTTNTDINVIPYVKLLRDKLSFLPKFYFQNWWISIQNKGDYNASHNHGGSDLSFIWYLTDNHSTLVFNKPEYGLTRQRLYLAFKNHKNNSFCTAWNWKCNAGDIVVFPSDTLHHTESYQGRGNRICIAGNIEVEI